MQYFSNIKRHFITRKNEDNQCFKLIKLVPEQI